MVGGLISNCHHIILQSQDMYTLAQRPDLILMWYPSLMPNPMITCMQHKSDGIPKHDTIYESYFDRLIQLLHIVQADLAAR
jgi:hypothetical protein